MRSGKFLASSASLFLAPMSMALSTLPPITFSEDPKICLPGGGVTSFSNCPALFSSINYCNEPSVITAGPDPFACICNQDYLNLLFGCHDEERLCIGDTDLDAGFQSGLGAWNSACEALTTAAITTPLVSSIIVSANLDWCTTVFLACESFSVSQEDCSSSYSGEYFFSCACKPNILSLMYTCQFLANTSCLDSSAALTNLVYYGYCPSLVSVLGPLVNETAPALTPATITSNGNPSNTPSNPETLTAPLAPGSSKIATGPTATKSSIGIGLNRWSPGQKSIFGVFFSLLLMLGW
ncbi:uncharacterized protein K444DRAFT_53885 [Hyaloscypha bicolor E]|uniref:Extracellular membrane protein CFEM domain-containing protein n=1 Tax=Hyaloscypha bicolor E TaxID=1095630 RepID=A0A2J6T344_9HELO|nr:uncharacterized protein K444DRAFT_53885 [Hyaloscypha bicolor E]PMD57429.1 hypothetical protein K444DRAFT_53885 [Hyaloscypha bicolor E]